MIFLGIDQTGAVDRRGRPKPLPACLIKNNSVSLFYLESFSEKIVLLKPDLICIDCVLGLPVTTQFSLREALAQTKDYKTFGRDVAQAFFANLGAGKKHTRTVEVTLNANSVFTVHPFQKNIQTGTYRFWKEMAESPDWFYFPALPKEKVRKSNRIPVVEGYPSYYWKILLKKNHRTPKELIKILKSAYPKLILKSSDIKLLEKDENLADALVLALAARKFKNDLSRKSHPEGWILGYSSERPELTWPHG